MHAQICKLKYVHYFCEISRISSLDGNQLSDASPSPSCRIRRRAAAGNCRQLKHVHYFCEISRISSLDGRQLSDASPSTQADRSLLLAGEVVAAAVAVSQASFLALQRAPTWILMRVGAEGAFRAGDQCDKLHSCSPAPKIEKIKSNFCLQWGLDHVLVMNLKDWFDCLLQLNLALNCPLQINRKQKSTEITNLQTEKIGIQ